MNNTWVEKIRQTISEMENVYDLESIVDDIKAVDEISTKLRNELYGEALRAGLCYGGDHDYCEEYCEIVENSTADNKFIKEAIGNARGSASGSHGIAMVSSCAYLYMEDDSLALEIFDQGIGQLAETWEGTFLFRVAVHILEDIERAHEVLRILESKFNARDCQGIAKDIAEYTTDINWAKEWYTKALKRATDWDEQYRIVSSIVIDLTDSSFAAEIFEECDYLGAIGLRADHAFELYEGFDHLYLMHPEGHANSNAAGIAITKECSLSDTYFFNQEDVEQIVFLLPGDYEGPMLSTAHKVTLIGLGDRSKVVISSNSQHTLFCGEGTFAVNNLTIRREFDESGDFVAVACMGDGEVMMENCIITHPDSCAVCTIGPDEPNIKIKNSTIVKSEVAVDCSSGSISLENVKYKIISKSKFMKGPSGKFIFSSGNEINELTEEKLFFNLYSNDEIWDRNKSDYENWDNSFGFGAYRVSLFGFRFSNNPLLVSFFNSVFLGGFYKKIFPLAGRKPGGLHVPTLGVYNAIDNQLIGLGLGRKDRLFIDYSGGPDFLRKGSDEFGMYDHGGCVNRLIANMEKVGIAHLDAAREDVQETADEHYEDMEIFMKYIRDAVPTFPEDISEVSPGDLG